MNRGKNGMGRNVGKGTRAKWKTFVTLPSRPRHPQSDLDNNRGITKTTTQRTSPIQLPPSAPGDKINEHNAPPRPLAAGPHR